MKMKTKGYKAGGKIKMVMKGGKKVPAFAADGVGKMATGGAVKKALGGMKHGGNVSADMVSPRKAEAMGLTKTLVKSMMGSSARTISNSDRATIKSIIEDAKTAMLGPSGRTMSNSDRAMVGSMLGGTKRSNEGRR